MKAKDIETRLAAGETTFAKKPGKYARSFTTIKIERIHEGFAIVNDRHGSPIKHRIAEIIRVSEAEAIMAARRREKDVWEAIDSTADELSQDIREWLETRPVPVNDGPLGDDGRLKMKLTFAEIRKLHALLAAADHVTKRASNGETP